MRRYLLIDGANMHAACKVIGLRVNWAKLLEMYQPLVQASYYTAVTTGEDGHEPLRKMLDWLSYNGFVVVEKPSKTYDNEGVKWTKGNMDVELVTDMLAIAPRADEIILATGDNDMSYAVQAAQRMGAKVIALSTIAGKTPPMGNVLRRQVNEFVDLNSIAAKLEQNAARPAVAEYISGN